METTQQVYLKATNNKRLSVSYRKRIILSLTRLGSSEAPPRTSDAKVKGSNPREGSCFRSNNVNNSVTNNDTGELDSSIESPRWALQVEEDITALGLKPTRPPVNCTMKDGTIDYI